MKKLFIILLFISCLISCEKKNHAAPDNNEVKATVVASPTSTITITAKGYKALMGTSFFGGGTFIDDTNETNAAVYINVYSSGIMAVNSPGTYSFSCEYRKNVADPNAPVYSNNGMNAGSITFTAISDHSMEGIF